jgi:hypothetical protein
MFIDDAVLDWANKYTPDYIYQEINKYTGSNSSCVYVYDFQRFTNGNNIGYVYSEYSVVQTVLRLSDPGYILLSHSEYQVGQI